MVCFEDNGNLLAYAGTILGGLAYVSAWVWGSHAIWFQLLYSAEMSLFGYALLSAFFPSVFAATLVSGVATGASLFLLSFAASSVSRVFFYLATVSVFLAAVVAHNADVLLLWMRDHVSASLPGWTGYAVLGGLALLVLGALYALRVVDGVLFLAASLVSSVLLFIGLRFLIIEKSQAPAVLPNGDTSSTQICCFSDAKNEMMEPPDRCPIDLWRWRDNVIFLALVVLSLLVVCWFHICCCCRKKKQYKLLKARRSPSPETAAAS